MNSTARRTRRNPASPENYAPEKAGHVMMGRSSLCIGEVLPIGHDGGDVCSDNADVVGSGLTNRKSALSADRPLATVVPAAFAGALDHSIP
jgi:hypothetical protein